MHRGEAEPGSLPLRLGGEERFEQPLEHVGTDAGATVLHGEGDVVARRDDAEPMLQGRAKLTTRRAHDDGAA